MISQVSSDTCISPNRDPITVGVPKFPADNSEEGIYYQKVLLAVERWFTLCGWPNGPHPISVPFTLRRYSRDSLYLKPHLDTSPRSQISTFSEFHCNRFLLFPLRVVAKVQTNISSAQTLRVTQNRDSRWVYEG